MSRERRGLFLVEESTAEPERFGCPMLVRARYEYPLNESLPKWRCSLGWAVRGDYDVACCQATESVCDCWKVHPERTPLVAYPATTDHQKASAD